jgi:hypothetical protein
MYSIYFSIKNFFNIKHFQNGKKSFNNIIRLLHFILIQPPMDQSYTPYSRGQMI